MDVFVDLDVVGALEGSDKSSSILFGWDYLRHYEMMFAEYRDAPMNMIEIGVSRGASLRMWHWFFPRAEIVGIDINPDSSAQAGPQMAVEIGSQIDPEFLDRVCERSPPTIIVDDGSHDYDHMIFSFEHLLPKLRPGGTYVVEDIVFHSGPGRNPRQGKPNVPEYFLDIARSCFAAGHLAASHPRPEFVTEMIDRVTFFGGAVALHKRDPTRDALRGAATADKYMNARERDPFTAGNFAEWLLSHEGPNDRALEAAEIALADKPGQPRLRLLKARALFRDGEVDGARAMALAVASTASSPIVLLAAAHLLREVGEAARAREVAVSALEKPGVGLTTRRRLESLADDEVT